MCSGIRAAGSAAASGRAIAGTGADALGMGGKRSSAGGGRLLLGCRIGCGMWAGLEGGKDGFFSAVGCAGWRRLLTEAPADASPAPTEKLNEIHIFSTTSDQDVRE